MQNLTIAQTLTMSSREIAELTEKQHKNVKRDIEKMLVDLGEDTLSFEHIYLDSMNRQQTEYLLDRDHTECLLTGYSAIHRMRVIKRWHDLEKLAAKPALPENYISALEALLDELLKTQYMSDFSDRELMAKIENPYIFQYSGQSKLRLN